LVWIVWPTTRAVEVRRPGTDAPVATLGEADALDAYEVVTGFTLAISETFP
jgi:hypothetical protein